jgi:(1->4)-alpha-D-glucan 1-alpha-D-glucosylmutase
MAEAPCRYTLQLENGAEQSGALRPVELERIARGPADGSPHGRYRWTLPALPAGYHQLRLVAEGQDAECQLIVAPARCYLPQSLRDGGRIWGPSLPLYAVRSLRNWGIGDLTDLANSFEFFAHAGAGTVGVSPLHSLYPHEPRHASPYSPSSRLFWNILYIDVEAVPGLADCQAARDILASPAFRARIATVQDEEQVDYETVATLKREVLEPLFEYFQAEHLARDTDLAHAYRKYVADAGSALHGHALYEALAEHCRAGDPGAWGWPTWPTELQSPDSPAVSEFAARRRGRVEFFSWLQWLAERQLAAVGNRAARLGVGLGLYLDVPLGVDRGGSEVWLHRHLFADAAAIGAPPDEFNMRGQDWGLPPWIPDELIESGYAGFIKLLRRNMRHAGALRLDHVMGLMRQFWVPAGARPADGAYVRYPVRALLGILKLESQRNQCAVIGEDLGTVTSELRQMLGAAGVLSNRLFYFLQGAAGDWLRPAELPRQALVALTNHDLPTLRGYWRGDDLALRHRLDLFPDEDTREAQVLQRAQDRARILIALGQQNLLPPGCDTDPARLPDLPAGLMVAVHRYLARSPAMVLAFQLDDALGVVDQINLPGTTSEYPNWRRKLPLNLEQWPESRELDDLLRALREERGSAAKAAPVTPQRELVIPRATYRLQLNAGFTFQDARHIVDYLERLGMSHLYLSPYLKARPGSQHGYDVTDHHSLNPEIGTPADLAALVATLREARMGQIADVVPNHMAVMGSDNRWWLDVLENGEASPFAGYFDIDWQPVRPELHGKVLIPVLGDHYGSVLERGDLRLLYDEAVGSLTVTYFEHSLPLDPSTYGDVLGQGLEMLAGSLGEDSPALAEYLSILRAFEQLPARRDLSTDDRLAREREKEVAKRRLSELCRREPDIHAHVATSVAKINGLVGQPDSFADLHALLENQAWRVAFWQVAADDINYRRFFDINELAALRVEDPELLEETHELIIAAYRDGQADGLRIDHPDGLYDPAGYCARLQQLLAGRRPDAQTDTVPRNTYLVVEKILAAHEHLRNDWPVHGTTGYDFAYLANALLVWPESEREFDRFYRDFTGERLAFDELLYRCKRLIVRVQLSSELTTLANLLNRITQGDWHGRDFTLNGLREALAQIAACFPVYRTYVTLDGAHAADREFVDWAVAWARRRDPDTNPDLYEYIRRLLVLEIPEHFSPGYRALCERFAMKFQQYTAPVTAKAVEDTAFYRYCRLVSLNEVGGNPQQFGLSVGAFHRNNQDRSRHWPHAMLAGSTHDNKRSEDVRARLNVLSELPGEWQARSRRWRRLVRRFRRPVGELMAPSRRDEYLYYQSLLGIWPLEPPDAAGLEILRERLSHYMRKAVREAKEHSSWMRPNLEYEAALDEFVAASLDADDGNFFLADLADFAARLAPFGLLNSLTQTTLRLTAPGIPDIYQGNELWDFSLVDPDNRRPVDFALRDRLLAELHQQCEAKTGPDIVAELMQTLPDGRMKLYLCWRLLQLRREHVDLFAHGDYLALPARGERADHLCAFARRHESVTVIVVVGRWFARLEALGVDEGLKPGDRWKDAWVELPELPGSLHDSLTGELVTARKGRLPVAGLLTPLPVAVLVAVG